MKTSCKIGTNDGEMRAKERSVISLCFFENNILESLLVTGVSNIALSLVSQCGCLFVVY
jgi:hypothetical protein